MLLFIRPSSPFGFVQIYTNFICRGRQQKLKISRSWMRLDKEKNAVQIHELKIELFPKIKVIEKYYNRCTHFFK